MSEENNASFVNIAGVKPSEVGPVKVQDSTSEILRCEYCDSLKTVGYILNGNGKLLPPFCPNACETKLFLGKAR